MFFISDPLGIISEYCAALVFFMVSKQASGQRITFSSTYTIKRARSRAIILTGVSQDLCTFANYTGTM